MNNEDKKKDAETKLFMAQKAEETSAFTAAILYADALTLFQELQDSEKVAFCLQKIRENNKEAQKSFHKASASQFVSDEEIAEVLEPIKTAKSIEDALVIFASHPAFELKYATAVSRVKEGPFIAHLIASTATVNKKGDFVKGGSDGEHGMVIFNYQIHHGIVSQIYFKRAWDILLEKGLTLDILVNFFQTRLGLTENCLELLRNGLKYVFDGEPVAAIHILIPRFENIILTLAEGLGLKTISLERNKKGVNEVATRDVMVTKDFLKNPIVQEKFGQDFCEYACFFLCEPLGINLRNRVAHGDVTLEDFSFEQALSLVRLLLFFPSRFQVTALEEGSL